MAYTLSRNLRLRLDSNLTANAAYNLGVLDTLGGTFIVDSTDTLQLRSRGDIQIAPESADLGGSGTGGTVTIGTTDQPIILSINATAFRLSSSLALFDQASGGSKYLQLQYKSDLTGPVDTTSNRALSVDLEGSDRQIVLGGNLSIAGGNLALSLVGATSLSLPASGTVATLSGAETLINKSISASQNTITSLTNANLSGSAGISYANLSLSGSLVNADISGTAAISYSKLNLTSQLVNADLSAAAAISRSKLASGTASHVLINDGTGIVSSEAQLSITRGGTGAGSAASGLNNLLPSQGSNSGKVLSTDGSNASWITSGIGTVRSATFTWSTGDGTTKVIGHSFATKDINIVVRDEADDIIGISSITATTTGSVTLVSSEAPATAWTVVLFA